MSFTPTVDDTDRYETIDITGERLTYPVSTATLAGVAAPIKGNNLLKASNNISDSSWTKTRASAGATVDVTLDSGEVVTLTKLVEDGSTNTHYAEQLTVGGNPANPAVLRFLFTGDGTRSFIKALLYGDTSSNKIQAVFNLGTGVVTGYSAGGTGTISGATITQVGTHSGRGVYLVTMSGLASSGADVDFYSARLVLQSDGVTDSYAGDSTSGVYIAQAQLTEGTEATTYQETTTERISGDGQRLIQSGDLGNAAWTKTRASISVTTHDATLDTGEVLVMQALLDTVDNNTHDIAQSSDAPLGSAAIVSVKVKLRDAAVPYARIILMDNIAGNPQVYTTVDLTTGAASGPHTSGTVTGTSVTSEDLGDGVFKVTLAGTLASGGGSLTRLVIRPSQNSGTGTTVYIGDGTKGIYIAEPVIVAGSTSPSYTRSYADRLAAGGSTRDRAYVLLPHIQEFDESGTHVGTLWDIDKPLVLTDGTDTDTRQVQFTAPVPANYAAVAAPAPYQWAPDGAGPTDNAYLHEIQAGNARKNPKRWEYDLATGQAEIWAMAGNTVTGQWRARRVVRDFVRRMTNGAGTYEYARARQEEDELIQIMAAFLSTR